MQYVTPIVMLATSMSTASVAHSLLVDEPIPLVTLAMPYDDEISLSDYWMSEKLDGIRAVWNGEKLLTRRGNVIHAPAWFTHGLPPTYLEGELWAGRGKFSTVTQTVLDAIPDESSWQSIRFMLFDMPTTAGSFEHRYAELTKVNRKLNRSHIQVVQQNPIVGKTALLKFLQGITASDGEGVMLRQIDAAYQAGRSPQLIKLKKIDDIDAIVIGYKPGKGKLEGMMGALHVRFADGQTIYVGSGFSHPERITPPPIGSVVTLQYSGLTSTGLPRFARFLRVRSEE